MYTPFCKRIMYVINCISYKSYSRRRSTVVSVGKAEAPTILESAIEKFAKRN